MSSSKKLKILNDILGDCYYSGKEHLFHCPRCEHHKRKLSINIEKNVFKCWVCDWSGRDIYRLVRRYGTHSSRGKWKEFFNRVEIESFADKMFGSKEIIGEQEISLPEEFVSLANKNLPATSLYPMNYLYDRGIKKEDIVRWKIGFCAEGEYEGRVIIPSFGISGKPNYFVARSYSRNWKKYMNPAASKDIVFNHLYLDFDDDMILVEGAFDAITAGPNAVPILGSTLRENSKLFQQIIKNDTPIYVALDTDAESKALRIISNLLKYDLEVYKVDIHPFLDAGEMTKKEFRERKQNATLMNSTSYLLKAIERI